MCYVTKNIYTVCAHTRIGELVDCKAQQARKAKLRDGGCFANLKLTLRSCRPVEQTQLRYWFCPECRNHFEGYDTNSATAILNYWAYKSVRGYSFAVSPVLISPDLVFGHAAPSLSAHNLPRLELLALDEAWPRKPFESRVRWLERLETARTMTLELAEHWSRARDRHETRQVVDAAVVGMQPRMSRPISVYPYSVSLSPIAESEEIDLPSPQVHLETLRKLCENASSEYALEQSWEASTVTSPAPLTEPTIRCLTASHSPQATDFEAAEAINHDNMPAENPFANHDDVWDNTPSAEPFQKSGKMLTELHLWVSTLQIEVDESVEPNMTSRFSVSDVDPSDIGDAAAIVSPLSDSFDVKDIADATPISSLSDTSDPNDIDGLVLARPLAESGESGDDTIVETTPSRTESTTTTLHEPKEATPEAEESVLVGYSQPKLTFPIRKRDSGPRRFVRYNLDI